MPDDIFGGGPTRGPVLEPHEVVERAVKSALGAHGYVCVKQPGDTAQSILDYGPLNWRKHLGRPPLRVAFFGTGQRTVNLTTFGTRLDLARIIQDCADHNDFGFCHNPQPNRTPNPYWL